MPCATKYVFFVVVIKDKDNKYEVSCIKFIMNLPEGGGGTPILDLTGCAAQQDVLFC